MSRPRIETALVRATLVALAMLWPLAGTPAEAPPKDISPAERALFMTDQIAALHPPMTLRYRFRRTGSLEPAFDDKVSIDLKAHADGRCCDATGEFLSGERKFELPPVENASGNPVTLFFLEREIHEMERLTKGKANYFRTRIRMALFQGATQRAVTMSYRGHPVAAQVYTITPYLDDPNRPRFEQLATKRYAFTLSDAVPGGIYAICTQVPGSNRGADAPPLLAEELTIEGADAACPAKAS